MIVKIENFITFKSISYKSNCFFTDKEIKKLEEWKEVYRYNDFGNISFGVRDYYYDWSF